jgi:hypothetical protein
MKRTRYSGFPDLPTLTFGLTSALKESGRGTRGLTILTRRPSSRASTFPSEIVTCRTDGGTKLRLFCKYASGYMHTGRDPRHGVGYEVEVYRNILEPLKTTTPRFCGGSADPTTGGAWLFLQYVEKSTPMKNTADPTIFLGAAARWIGRFHAAHEGKRANTPLSFMVAYDAKYYLGCARRTSLYANGLHRKYPWLKPLCRYYEDLVDLLTHTQTIIHGEYEIANILTRNHRVYPVDWEAAAIGAGEIDLATLTCRWRVGTIRECEREYCRARWPDGPPPEFERRLAAARLHYCFRWLACRREWTRHKSASGWFSALRATGEQMGLI